MTIFVTSQLIVTLDSIRNSCDILQESISGVTFTGLRYSLFRVCFEEYGGDVKFWITLNEPKETSLQGHGSGTMAPGLKGPGTLVYEAAHNQIR